MGLGFPIETGGGAGDILPFCKYDSRGGRLTRNDRTQDGSGNYVSSPVDITRTFRAVIDLANLEVGWMHFAAGQAPQMHLARLGEAFPDEPAGPDKFRRGARLTMKLDKNCGGDVREMSGNSTVFLRGVDELHTAFEAGSLQNPGKLPVVTLPDTKLVTSGSGDKKSTNYQPVFEIVAWVDRPADLQPRASTPAPTPAVTPTHTGAPPATGSTRVGPPGAAPVQTTNQPSLATAGADDDFG